MSINATTPQLKAVQKWIDAVTALDISKVIPTISRNFKYQSFPKPIHMPEIHEQEMEAHVEWLKGLLALWTKIDVNIHEAIEAPGKVVTHASMLVTLIDGTTHEYDDVAIFTLIEEDGEIKLLDFKDFTDPYKRDAYFAAIAKLAAQRTPAS